jgi:hypothetical protein
MDKRMLFGAASLLLAGGLLATTPAACSSGGGGVGIGVATLGISSILAGSSPGWRLTDPSLASGTSGPVTSVLTVTQNAKPEAPDPSIAAGDALDRVIVAGGDIRPPVRIAGFVTPTAGSSELDVQLLVSEWDGEPRINELLLASATVTGLVAGTQNAIAVTLDFSTLVAGGTTYRDPHFNVGDQYTVRFINPATAGAIVLDPRRTTIGYSSRQVRETTFDLAGNQVGFDAQEHIQVTAVGSGLATTIFAEGNGQATLGVGQVGIFRFAVVDQQQNSVGAGEAVSITATNATAPSAVAVVTDADGIASARFSFPAAATMTGGVVTATLQINGQQAQVMVNVSSTAARSYDGLESFNTGGDQNPTATDVSVSIGNICVPVETGGGFIGATPTASRSSLPTDVEFDFPATTSSNAQWRYDVFVRTTSLQAGATSRLVIQIEDESTTVFATSGQLDVGAGLTELKGVLTPSAPLSFVPNLAPGPQAAFRIVFTATQSSDAQSPGVDVITDPTARSTINAPGPVLWATSSTSGDEFLVSSPDPRK